MKLVFSLCIAMIFLACNSASDKKEPQTADSVTTVAEQKIPVATEQCYLFIAVKDTYALKLNIIDTKVTGTAVYKNYEKDSSHGAVEGEMEGDIIHLWYRFQSEGMNSVRELYFKKQNGSLLTGIANEATRGDTAYVPDAGSVKFTGSVYEKADCSLVPHL